MPKRTRAETDSEALKLRVLSDLSYKGKEETRSATDFTLDEAIRTFGLKFEHDPTIQKHYWDIENEVGTNEFPITPYFESLLNNYSNNFDRTSKSMCRTAVDFMLNECLTVMKGLNTASDARPDTPSPLHDIKVYGEVSFTHTVISQTTTCSSPNIVIGGRVDHAIGRVLRSCAKNATSFYSLLLLVEPKFPDSVAQAIPQLVVYLASLHQSRLQRNRTDTSVYGLASDGYAFVFVKISHDGTVMRSRQLGLLQGDMKKILGCLTHILEITASRSPLERDDDDRDEDEADELLNLDDNKFLHPPGPWEDEEDEEDDY